MVSLFVRAWKGEASLAAAFWLVYFLFGIILAIIVGLIFKLFVTNFSYLAYQQLIAAICFPYTLFSVICVWRCAKNSHIAWNILAKIVVVLAVIFGVFNIWALITQPALQEPTSMTQPQ